jgi:hypothetical protein
MWHSRSGALEAGESDVRSPALQFQQATSEERERMARGGCEDLFVESARVGEVAAAMQLGRRLQRMIVGHRASIAHGTVVKLHPADD